MTYKSSREQLEAMEKFDKTVEQFDKEIEHIETYKPSKEKLTKSIIQTIKEFQEGRITLSSPLK